MDATAPSLFGMSLAKPRFEGFDCVELLTRQFCDSKETTMSDIYGIRQFGLIEKGLDLRLVRQNGIASNVANASTPGYKEVNVGFEKELSQALGKEMGMAETHPGHLPNAMMGVAGVKPTFSQVEYGARIDGNTVDFERVMVKDALNGTEYDAIITAFNKFNANLFRPLEE
jgi:flagellar basal-body rod protein FlgB